MVSPAVGTGTLCRLNALATTGIGVRVLARRREQPPPGLLGIVEPSKARRRKAMRRG